MGETDAGPTGAPEAEREKGGKSLPAALWT